jgi:hypothetical protein
MRHSIELKTNIETKLLTSLKNLKRCVIDTKNMFLEHSDIDSGEDPEYCIFMSKNFTGPIFAIGAIVEQMIDQHEENF